MSDDEDDRLRRRRDNDDNTNWFAGYGFSMVARISEAEAMYGL